MKRVVTGSVMAGVILAGLAATFVGINHSATDAIAAPKKPAAKSEPAPLTVVHSVAAPAAVAPATPAAAAPAAATGPGQDKVAYIFPNEETLNEFAKLSQQRQGILVRMSVLRAYFSEEQASLSELDKKMVDEYKLDMNKNYTYDPQRRALIEREPASQGGGSAGAAMSSTPASSSPPSLQ